MDFNIPQNISLGYGTSPGVMESPSIKISFWQLKTEKVFYRRSTVVHTSSGRALLFDQE